MAGVPLHHGFPTKELPHFNTFIPVNEIIHPL